MNNDPTNNDDSRVDESWESDIGALLSELSGVQTEFLELLSEKTDVLKRADLDGMAALQPRAEELTRRLLTFRQRRSELLGTAEAEGLPHESIESLAAALPATPMHASWNEEIQASKSRTRMLQHKSLINWLACQRTLIHLSQMLEIIATGGNLQPTYGVRGTPNSAGSLVDQEA